MSARLGGTAWCRSRSHRDSLVAAGLARADDFAMERVAERFIGIYERTIAERDGLDRAS
jgi:hypothetical protein